LRLTGDERAYLFGLARQRPRGEDEAVTEADPSLAGLVADLAPRPAMVMNHRFDLLAWNSEMAKVLVDFDTLAPSRRNAIWLCLLHPEIRERYVDRDRIVRDGVAHLRAAWAAHPEDQVLAGLIAECVTGDEEFARLWAAGDVRLNGRGDKVMRHPLAGRIALRFETLTSLQDPGPGVERQPGGPALRAEPQLLRTSVRVGCLRPHREHLPDAHRLGADRPQLRRLVAGRVSAGGDQHEKWQQERQDGEHSDREPARANDSGMRSAHEVPQDIDEWGLKSPDSSPEPTVPARTIRDCQPL
jgi:hypothetical protein